MYFIILETPSDVATWGGLKMMVFMLEIPYNPLYLKILGGYWNISALGSDYNQRIYSLARATLDEIV